MNDGTRRTFLKATLSAAALGVAGNPRRGTADPSQAVDVARSAGAAAQALIESVTAAGRARLLFELSDANRTTWHYLPTLVDGIPDALRASFHDRRGLSLKDMNGTQRDLALDLLRTVLDDRGFATVQAIIRREDIVRDRERAVGSASGVRALLGDEVHARVRDPSLYFFALFGEPGDDSPWSFRCEGHHLSLHAAFVPGAAPAVTPMFFGAFPASLEAEESGPSQLLIAEAGAFIALVRSLRDDQRAEAAVAQGVPDDILAEPLGTLDLASPTGLPAAEMSGVQQELLWQLIELYAMNFRPQATAAELRRVRRSGIERLHLACAGAPEIGRAHYFRLHGPRLLIEYDNVQNGANHVHTVYRDPHNDFGSDDLRRHWRESHIVR